MVRMRSISLRVLVGIAAVALAGCESATPTAPARVPKAPSLSAVSDNERLPFAFNVRGCTERVRGTGTFPVLVLFHVAMGGGHGFDPNGVATTRDAGGYVLDPIAWPMAGLWLVSAVIKPASGGEDIARFAVDVK